MEATLDKERVPLVCIGRNYNKKQVLTFIMTRGDEKKDGEAYEARFPGSMATNISTLFAVLKFYLTTSNIRIV